MPRAAAQRLDVILFGRRSQRVIAWIAGHSELRLVVGRAMLPAPDVQ